VLGHRHTPPGFVDNNSRIRGPAFP
jgi:hypothetical protein